METLEDVEGLSSVLEDYECSSGLFLYEPHEKQGYFHASRSFLKLFMGGNQSGKTTALLVELLGMAFGVHVWSGELYVNSSTGRLLKPPVRLMLGSLKFSTHMEVTIPKLRELIPWDVCVERVEKVQGGAISKIYFRDEWGGSSIRLMSYEMDVMAWEGATYHGLGFDEPPPRHAWIASKRGAMRWSAPIVMSMTPTSQVWIYDEVVTSPKAIEVSSSSHLERCSPGSYFVTVIDTDENPHLSRQQKDEFYSTLTPEEILTRKEGRYSHLEGLIYKGFSVAEHVLLDRVVETWPAGASGALEGERSWRDWPSGLVVDPHDRKPWACGWFVMTPRNELIWIDEWPEFDFFRISGWPSDVDRYHEVFEEVRERHGLTNMVWFLMDPNFGRQPKAGTGKTLVDEFAAKGIYFETNFSDDLAAGHIEVRRALHRQEMFWLERCRNFVHGMQRYTWSERRTGEEDHGPKEVPRLKYKDFPDLARYARMAGVCWLEESMFKPAFDRQELSHGGFGPGWRR